jgi:cytochrome b
MQGVPRRIPPQVSSGIARIRVWDSPTRIFHWTLVLLVVFSFTTGKIGGDWMTWHLRSGYAILALLLFRLAWGFAGGSSARFATFLRGPRAALEYARATFSGRHPFTAGHNPAGGWMVVLMLALLLVQAASGLFADDEIATQGPLAVKVSNAVVAKMSSLHSYNSWALVVAVSVHVIAVAAYQWGLKVDLLGPMFHGWKTVPPGMRPPEPTRGPVVLATVLLAISAGLVYALVVVYPKV